jgi:uncharacterized hydrophobic protein (TIGR00341 family)
MLRLIEVIIPKERGQKVLELLEEYDYLDMWEEPLSDERTLFKILVEADSSEGILDELQEKFSLIDEFRLVILPVEASLPRPPEKEKKEQEEEATEEEKNKKKKKISRISRDELYSDVVEMTKISPVFVVLIILSAVVAAIGLYTQSVAVIIGAMVIAPLLGPNVAFSFATTLGDRSLAKIAQKANILGILLALLFSVGMGVIFKVDPESFEIASRTTVGMADIILAMASGAAGAISITMGVATALVGVMVAVALLPPLVTFGLLLGAGFLVEAEGALLLFLINLICVNLSGVVVFLAQGIRPRTWWEAEKARRSTWTAIGMWTILLIILVLAVLILEETL